MSGKNEMFYCKKCKKLIQVAVDSTGSMTCCATPLTPLTPNTFDAAPEKHVPVVIDKEDCIEVRIGDVDHPMTAEHHIVFIEVHTVHGVNRKYFKPGDPPHFHFPYKMFEIISVLAFCNLHMLWSDSWPPSK